MAHSGYDILATARAHVCGVIHLKLDILQTLTCVQRRDKVGYNCFWAQETQYAPVSSWWCTTGCCWCTRYSLVLLQVALRMAFWVYAWMQLQMNSKKNMEIMHGFLFCFWVELKKKDEIKKIWSFKNVFYFLLCSSVILGVISISDRRHLTFCEKLIRWLKVVLDEKLDLAPNTRGVEILGNWIPMGAVSSLERGRKHSLW